MNTSVKLINVHIFRDVCKIFLRQWKKYISEGVSLLEELYSSI